MVMCILKYDEANISEKSMDLAARLMELPEMTAENMKNASVALDPIGFWIRAIIQYNNALKFFKRVNRLKSKSLLKGVDGRCLEEMVDHSLAWYRSLSTEDREKLDAYNEGPEEDKLAEFN